MRRLDEWPLPKLVALLPLLIVKEQFNLTSNDIAVLVIAFIVLELVLSRILFRLKIRDRPF